MYLINSKPNRIRHTSKFTWSYPTSAPNQDKMLLKSATADTKAIILAIMPKTIGIPARAPFVAASIILVSCLA
jgi:hypothetical protein